MWGGRNYKSKRINRKNKSHEGKSEDAKVDVKDKKKT